MDARRPGPGVVVVTGDPELLEHVLAVCAAAGVEPTVLGDAAAVRPLWAAAGAVVLGVDQAPQLAAMVLPRRSEVFVVGEEADRDPVWSWSLPLGAAVVLVPSGAQRLTTALIEATGSGRGQGQVVAVVGGSGGVGASTCAAALALASAHRGVATLLVDADPLSGGLDLLVGAERVPGWRWPRFGTARGHLGTLVGQLPQVDGLDVLAMARGGAGAGAPDGEQMGSVLQSATRSHVLTVVDVPRALTPAGREALRRADTVLLLVHAQLRAVAAARQLLGELTAAGSGPGLVVRLSRPRALSADVVADGLGVRLVCPWADDPSVALEAARGEPPGRSGRSPLGRSSRELLDAVTRMAVAR